MIRRVLVVLPIALAAACGGSSEVSGNPLGQVLLRDGPAGFTSVKGPASGPMDLEAVINSTPADTTAKRRFLRRSGYQDGYSRVWTKGDDYVTALAHEFSSESGAAGLVDFEITEVSSKRGSTTFSVPEVPNGKGYILSGVKRKGLKPVFCQGVWFAAGTRTFNVNTCGAQPNSPEIVRRLAIEQAKDVK